jgi:hypothetical protein
MYFAELHASLLDSLRARVRNGQLTERSLARLVGVSQPHMHNVLKGTRFLSSDLADQILLRLNLSVFDLVDRGRLTHYLSSRPSAVSECTSIPVLSGALGPGFPWPAKVDTYRTFPVPTDQLNGMTGAVVAMLAEDTRMRPTIQPGDFALLDQSLRARCTIDPDALYIIKKGDGGSVRRLRPGARGVFVATDDCLSQPAAWERISLDAQSIQHVVRAKATLLSKDTNWID